jgi:hypothetical protein
MSAFFDYPDERGEHSTEPELVFLEGLTPGEWERLIALMERRRRDGSRSCAPPASRRSR